MFPVFSESQKCQWFIVLLYFERSRTKPSISCHWLFLPWHEVSRNLTIFEIDSWLELKLRGRLYASECRVSPKNANFAFQSRLKRALGPINTSAVGTVGKLAIKFGTVPVQLFPHVELLQCCDKNNAERRDFFSDRRTSLAQN